jgi:hypothetical protein
VATPRRPIDCAPVLTFAISHATNATICLLATFLGIGLVVNGLIVYIVVLAHGERRENERGRQRRPGADATRATPV